MSSPGIRVALASLLLLTGMRDVAGQEQIFRQDFGDLRDTFVQVESIFGNVARQGALPYRITARNNSRQDRVWTVEFREGYPGRNLGTVSRYRMEVNQGTELVRDVTLSFAPAHLAYDHRNLNIAVSSAGLPSQSRSQGEQTNQNFPTLAMSKTLAQRSLAKLDDLVKKANSGDPRFAKSYDPAYLPADWKGYSALDAFLIDRASWERLSPAQSQAILAWVRLGGLLDIYADTEVDIPGLNLPSHRGEPGESTARISLGEIRIHSWNGSELPGGTVKRYESLPTRSDALDRQFSTTWNLQQEFGTESFNPVFVFFLLLAFAILVAPVNLYCFAKAGRRHLLFLTTPLISVITCILIILLILFIDGIGGKGIRVVLADLQASRDEMKLYLSQEQISRTGVIVNPGFESRIDFDINPANLPASHYNPLSPGGRRSTLYEIGGGKFNGGFFRSRSEQAFSLRGVEPTRSRIELTERGTPENPPALTSTFPQTLTDLAYLDKRGELWISPPGTTIPPGETTLLEKSPEGTWPAWMDDAASRFSETKQEQVASLRSERNRFFARVEKPDQLALSTHPRIRWETTHLLLTGTPTDRVPPSGNSESIPPNTPIFEPVTPVPTDAND